MIVSWSKVVPTIDVVIIIKVGRTLMKSMLVRMSMMMVAPVGEKLSSASATFPFLVCFVRARHLIVKNGSRGT